MSRKHVVVVGTEASRLARIEEVLRDTGLQVVDHIASAAEVACSDAPAPALAVLDASQLDVDQAAAGVALLDAGWPGTPCVVVHDDTNPAVVRTILDAGAVSIVQTTLGDDELRATLGAGCEGRGLIDVDVVRPVIDLYATMHAESRRRNRAVIESLAAAVEAKDTVTSRHLRAVSRLATQLARQVEPSYCEGDDFLFGCLLHDVGKIGVPEKILMKPGALTEDEWEVMRRHPQTGARVVRPLGLAPVVTDVVLYHHERWDGRGYPERLAADEIPLAARIFSVCDALEAMTATRPYRGPLPVNVAFERVKIESGQQFDPDVITALSDGVSSGAIDLEDSGDLDVEQPARRRISSAVR
ncbi:MAG TPA: HD-GYP domain-containing protein [Solirubrobacteraceae bacterium]|nr:HD-GYP domain-containing protein [Solirubrobacteraceae bacterium]